MNEVDYSKIFEDKENIEGTEVDYSSVFSDLDEKDETTKPLTSLTVDNSNAELLKQEIKQNEYNELKTKIDKLPEETYEQKENKKKAIIAFQENKEDLSGFDRSMLSMGVTLRSMASPFLGIAELSEDISNFFRDDKKTDYEDFRKEWNKLTEKMEAKLGYTKEDILKPSLSGKIGSEIALVASGQKALSTVSTALSGLKTTAGLEASAAFLSELGSSGDYVEALKSGSLAGGITGIVGKFIEGKQLSDVAKKSLDNADKEELVNIANIYEFAKNSNIKVVDAMLSNNPNKIVSELKSFSAPESLIEFAESLKTDTGSKLLDAFNDVFKNVKPNDIEDIELRKIAELMQKESSSLKNEMNKLKNEAYSAMKESELKTLEVSTKDVLDIGLKELNEFRADASLVNAYKRNVLKNITTLDTNSNAIAKRIKTLEEKIARNQERMSGFEIEGINTDTIEKSIEKDIAELNKISENIDMSKISNLTSEDIVGVIKDMNELKYSGSAHIATKGAKEQKLITNINESLMKKIKEVNPEFHDLAKDASEKARDVFSLYGKQGRGTYEFPELEKIRTSNNPDDIAKTIFKANATESGFKIEQTLKILGERNPELKKKVIGKYINDAIGGFDKYVKGKNTIKQNVLDLDDGLKAIDNLIGTPDKKRLIVDILGKDKVDTLFSMQNFLKQHSDNLKAMSTPNEKKEAGILSAPVIKQLSQFINWSVYKTRNKIPFMKDKFHSEKYQKTINRYISKKLDEFERGKKGRVEYNKLAYALSGSAIEKAIRED